MPDAGSYTREPSHPLAALISPAIDVATLCAYWLLLPWLAQSFTTPSLLNGAIIIGAFAILLLALYATNWLASGVDDRPKKKSAKRSKKKSDEEGCGCASGCGWGPIFVMCIPLMYCGFLTIVLLETTTSIPFESDSYDVAGAGLMFGGAVLIGLALILPTTKAPGRGSWLGLGLHALSVLGISLITLVGFAFWDSVMLATSEAEVEEFHGIWKLIMFLLIYGVFVMFLGPPRIYLHLIRGDRLGLVTFLASIAYYVWELF